MLKSRFLLLLFLLLFIVPPRPARLAGTTYYVDNTAAGNSDSNAGTNPALPFTNITRCNAFVVAGDTCSVAGSGSYDQNVNMTKSGTSGNPITYIATGSPAAKVRSFYFTSANWTTVQGFDIDQTSMSSGPNEWPVALTGTNTGVSIINNTIHHHNGTRGQCIRYQNTITTMVIRGNTISYCQAGDNDLTGTSEAIVDGGGTVTDVLVENNYMTHLLDFIHPIGTKWVIRNNTCGPINTATGVHVDCVQDQPAAGDGGTVKMLIENNYDNHYSSDSHFILNSNAAGAVDSVWIARYNRMCLAAGGGGPGSTGNTTADNKMVYYNNTFYNNENQLDETDFLTSRASGSQAFNNILVNTVRPVTGNTYGVNSGGTWAHLDYDLYFNQPAPSPAETHVVNADPSFVDAANCDLHLNSGSPALDKGGPLTTTNGSGSSSTSITLTAPQFFQDWADHPDCIAVGSVSNTACFVANSINYTTGAATLDAALTWSNGANVWLYKRSDGTIVLYGAAPDIGAYESPAQSLAFTTQPVNVHTGGTMTAFVVTVRNADGSTDTTSSVSITVAISSCGASAGGTLTVAASSGIATFNAVTATGNGVNCQFTATATNIGSGTSNIFNVGPNKLGITVQPSSSYTSGTSITFTVAGQYNDGTTDTSSNNSVTASLTVTTGSGALTGSTTQSLSSGVRAFSLTISGAGTFTITASASGLTSATTNAFSVTGDTLAFTTQPPSSTATGSTLSVIAVTVRLPGGSTDTSVTNAVTLVGSGCVITAPNVNPSSGIATFTNNVVVSGSGNCVITASALNVTSGNSNTFTVTGVPPPVATTTGGFRRLRVRAR